MTFRDWQQIPPAQAARELHRRVHTLLAPPQQRAAIAVLRPEPELAEAFARANRGGPLGGVPYFVKDLFDVAGMPTRAGSTFLPETRPTPEADSRIVVALREAGAVLAGKTHLHEFAYGITGENPHYGDCERPGAPGRTSGGSSSGSAAVVAAGVVPLAVGTDTGGSIRVPAAFCGLFGLRLGSGDALVREAFPLARTFDTAGWFTTNGADLLTTLRTLLRLGDPDRAPVGCYLEPPGLDPDVAAAYRAAAEQFGEPADPALAATLLDGFAGSLDTYNRIVGADAWAVHAGWADRFQERYDPAVWHRLVAAREQDPRQVEQAQVAMASIRLLWAKYFLGRDFLILPAAPCPALWKVDCTLENRRRLLAVGAPVSVAGLPALTIPFPLPQGLTGGLQVVVHDAAGPVLPWILQRYGHEAPEPSPGLS